jgi:hypothetical protein
VVRRWIKLGDWNGKANAWSIPVQKLKGDGIDEAAVVCRAARRKSPRPSLAARSRRFIKQRHDGQRSARRFGGSASLSSEEKNGRL